MGTSPVDVDACVHVPFVVTADGIHRAVLDGRLDPMHEQPAFYEGEASYDWPSVGGHTYKVVFTSPTEATAFIPRAGIGEDGENLLVKSLDTIVTARDPNGAVIVDTGRQVQWEGVDLTEHENAGVWPLPSLHRFEVNTGFVFDELPDFQALMNRMLTLSSTAARSHDVAISDVTAARSEWLAQMTAFVTEIARLAAASPDDDVRIAARHLGQRAARLLEVRDSWVDVPDMVLFLLKDFNFWVESVDYDAVRNHVARELTILEAEAWIDAGHGSEVLRRYRDLGMLGNALSHYRGERMAADRPGWTKGLKATFKRVPRPTVAPPAEVIDWFVTVARESAPECNLRAFRVAGRDESTFPDGVSAKTVWYAAEDHFAGIGIWLPYDGAAMFFTDPPFPGDDAEDERR